VSLTDEGLADPLLGGLPAKFDAFQAHAYTTELPYGGIALARSGQGLQAFRIKSRVWGLQFHPEPSEDMIEGWLHTLAKALEQQGIKREDVSAQASRDVPMWSLLGAGIAQRFVQVVRSLQH
jgi:GMP synthase (glutamine-hydrolysing)